MRRSKVGDLDLRQVTVSNDGSQDSISTGRSSTDEVELCQTHYRSLKHQARLRRVPLVGVVLVVSAVLLLAPVLVVWGLNISKIIEVSASRKTEALLRRSDYVAARLIQKFETCEGEIA